MKTKMKKGYRLVQSDLRENLESQVEVLLAEGWEPLGGVIVMSVNGNIPRYTQTMWQAGHDI